MPDRRCYSNDHPILNGDAAADVRGSNETTNVGVRKDAKERRR